MFRLIALPSLVLLPLLLLATSAAAAPPDEAGIPIDDDLLRELEEDFVGQPTDELTDLAPAAPPRLPPKDIVPLIGAPWAFHTCAGISPLHTSQQVLLQKLGRPLRTQRSADGNLTYYHYNVPNARLTVEVSAGVVQVIDAFPKLPLVLGGAIEEFELSTPVKVPKLAPSAQLGPPVPARQDYFRCGWNVVAFTQPGTGNNEGDVVTQIRFHPWRTGRYGSDSDAQFGRLPPKFVTEIQGFGPPPR